MLRSFSLRTGDLPICVHRFLTRQFEIKIQKLNFEDLELSEHSSRDMLMAADIGIIHLLGGLQKVQMFST